MQERQKVKASPWISQVLKECRCTSLVPWDVCFLFLTILPSGCLVGIHVPCLLTDVFRVWLVGLLIFFFLFIYLFSLFLYSFNAYFTRGKVQVFLCAMHHHFLTTQPISSSVARFLLKCASDGYLYSVVYIYPIACAALLVIFASSQIAEDRAAENARFLCTSKHFNLTLGL